MVLKLFTLCVTLLDETDFGKQLTIFRLTHFETKYVYSFQYLSNIRGMAVSFIKTLFTLV